MDALVDVMELVGRHVLADRADDGLSVANRVLEQLPDGQNLSRGPVIRHGNLDMPPKYGPIPRLVRLAGARRSAITTMVPGSP